MPPDTALVRRKLSKLIEYLTEIGTLTKYTLDEYLSNHFIHRTAERLLQLIVEVSTDINGYLLVDAGEKPPSSYYDSFTNLIQPGILDRELALKLAPITGLRNDYEEIDNELVYRGIGVITEIYHKYIESIEAYLERI